MSNYRTQQGILGTAVRGIVAQGALAKDGGGRCRYKTPDGLRCAIGQCIYPNRYHEDLEGLIDYTVLRAARIQFKDEAFARDLQKAHDSSHDVKGFLEQAQRLALRYNLIMPEVGHA